MTVRIVRLGSARARGEGLRIGAVRYPPRGVRKEQYAEQNWYDAWLPELAPGPRTLKLAQGARTDRDWTTFAKRYRAEMSVPDKRRLLDLLAAMSHHADFSVGCYCEDESRCHRSVLRELLKQRGARLS